MSIREIERAGALHGEIEVPGDKSISHRSIMLGALAEGDTRASHFLMSADCLSTISCFRQLGIDIEEDREADTVVVHGKGLHGLQAPSKTLDTGNSGTTTRILSGILAGQTFQSQVNGDSSIQTRPMKRIIRPLTEMGARIISLRNNDCTPLSISGGHLHGIDYLSPVASAQVKSCILLAGLYADGRTSVTEPSLSRNHTELMLRGFGAEISSRAADECAVSGTARDAAGRSRMAGMTPWRAEVCPEPRLRGQEIIVPGDISSAAYFIAAGLIVPGSEILVKNVGINPTRAGILQAARDMGGQIEVICEYDRGGEKAADLLVKSSSLHGTTIEGALIPTLIDEIPVIAVMAAYAEGTTVIRDAAELKVKESDRIAAMTENLKAMGADIVPEEDGMVIRGTGSLRGASVRSFLDHRVAMSMAVAALAAEGTTTIEDADCVLISYPSFYEDLEKLI
ncbi:3-phosphoshikimate 1-carboxyvinyltransferase [Porcincola sp. LCP21S3_C12]|uniref:3-phosphoshikimate 1-carboxyvinyltransferase n=1 Tax=Porcincola sp. LCP21S3_C12 TaxID=3438798 RepID=UPI003F98A5E2